MLHPFRCLVRLKVLAILTVSLIACSTDSEEPEQSRSRQHITWLHYFGNLLVEGPELLNTVFNDPQEDFELTAVALEHEAFKTSMPASIGKSYAAELYSNWAGTRTARVSQHLQKLDDLWQEEMLDERFSPRVFDTATTYDGHKYLLPLVRHHIGFIYNKAVFSRLGLQPPQDWADFLALIERLKEAGLTPVALGAQPKWPAQFWFDYLLLRTAPVEFRQALLQGQARFTDDRVARAFALWRELLEAGAFNRQPAPNETTWEVMIGLLLEEKAAMTLTGSWALQRLNSHEGADFGIFSFPVIDPALPRVALGPVDGLVMSRHTAASEGARAVLKFAASRQVQKTFSQLSGGIAASSEVVEADYSLLQRQIKAELENSAAFVFNFDLSATPLIARLGLNAFVEFLEFPGAYMRILQDVQQQLDNPAPEAAP